MVKQDFKIIEDCVKSYNLSIELYQCDYDKYGIKRIVIRFPVEKNEKLGNILLKQGWKKEKDEYIRKRSDSDSQIKGWISNGTGRKYLRMSFAI